MIEDLLQEIVALEREQEAKVRQSQQDSKDIVAEAKQKANEIENNAEAKIKKLKADNIQKANADAQKQVAEIIAAAHQEAEKIAETAQKNSDKIIADVIGRLEVRYA